MEAQHYCPACAKNVQVRPRGSNKTLALGIVGVIVAVILGYFAFGWSGIVMAVLAGLVMLARLAEDGPFYCPHCGGKTMPVT